MMGGSTMVWSEPDDFEELDRITFITETGDRCDLSIGWWNPDEEIVVAKLEDMPDDPISEVVGSCGEERPLFSGRVLGASEENWNGKQVVEMGVLDEVR